MSASPSGPSNSGTPTGNGVMDPNGPKPKFIRRRKPADPLRQNTRPPPRPVTVSKSTVLRQNGLKHPARPGPTAPGGDPSRPGAKGSLNPNGANPRPKAPTSFTQVPDGTYQDFPLYTTKRLLREGLRYHVARFAGKKVIDPSNQDEFTRPVSLHRRDPRQLPPGKTGKDDPASSSPVDDKEQEKLEIARLEKEAQRAADLAQIAPSGNNASALAARKNAAPRNEKTTQVYRVDKTEEQKKESDLRYEEALPWHLEDAENKHTWVGSYEAALSDTNVILVIDGNSFKMVPLEKWYKFTAKGAFTPYTIEQAEAKMNQKSKASRWVMHAQEKQQQDQEHQATRRQLGNLYKVKGESSTFKRSGKTETQDADDLDFEDNLFQDDDEQATMEPDNDEETKYAAEKIKREQLGANLFGEADENEVEREFEEEEKEAEARRTLGKSMKRALQKREKNYAYESDSDNGYSTSSDEEKPDDENKKEEDRKKEEEAKLKAKSAAKLPSGASTKGTNTPPGKQKQGENPKKHNHLKRPGSPNLSASEASGNESSRKKPKKKHTPSSSQPTGTSTPRHVSPAPPASQPASGSNGRKSSIIKLNVNPSKLSEIQSAQPNPSPTMSDGEGTAGEMSDGPAGKRKSTKFRLRAGQGNSPSASRAGSPTKGSRAGSPVAAAPGQAQAGQSPPPPSSSARSAGPITVEEIKAALPPEGISIGAINKLFGSRIHDDKEARRNFIAMIKENSEYNAGDKLLRPLSEKDKGKDKGKDKVKEKGKEKS